MKRLLCLVLVSVLFLSALPARALTVSDVMQVTNCSEWVSLRQSPDKSSKRLAKVYLGELVSLCVAAPNDFVQCDYQGTTGYIMGKYLKTTGFTNGDELLRNQMVVNVEEWASLRQYADTKSQRLAKVPVGAIVTGCVKEGDFILCTYQKKTGYIPTQYLRKADYNAAAKNAETVSKAEQQNYPSFQNPMEVVNCSDWVSLRAKPSASSARLAKVPLGAFVTDCVQVSDTFVFCKYRNVEGYIQLDYLKSHDEQTANHSTVFDSFTERPSYTAFLAAGETVLNYHAANGYTIVVQRAYSDVSEEIMAVCYNMTGQPVWQVGDKVDEIGQTTATAAFIAGTQDDPEVVFFCAGRGFVAYDVDAWHDVQWEWREGDALTISAGLSAAVDVEGTIYVTGYFSDTLVAISADGEFLWKASHADPNIYWPYDIVIEKDHVDVWYETPSAASDMHDVISYSKDGTLLSTQRKIREAEKETL